MGRYVIRGNFHFSGYGESLCWDSVIFWSVFVGDVKLTNLQLKSSALDDLDLPFQITHGRLSEFCNQQISEVDRSVLCYSEIHPASRSVVQSIALDYIGVFLQKVRFRSWCLSFTVFVGNLVLKIPWKNLYKQPVVVTISGLYLVAVPKTGEI